MHLTLPSTLNTSERSFSMLKPKVHQLSAMLWRIHSISSSAQASSTEVSLPP